MTIWKAIDESLEREMDRALAEYRAGADAVVVTFGELRLSFTDLKNNDERERVKISLPSLLTMLRAMAMTGAAMAASSMAQAAADLAGFALADLSEQDAEAK